MAARFALFPGPNAPHAALSWRALGAPGDLDIDFGSTDRPAMVSAVLSACADPVLAPEQAEGMWRLTVSARIGGLLAIWAESTGRDVLELQPRCPVAICRQGMEVALPANALAELAQEAERTDHTTLSLPGGRLVRLRRPRGVDQRLWRSTPHATGDSAAIAIMLSLTEEGLPTAEDRAAISDAMAAFDPLSCFALEVTCPHCGAELSLPVDLEAVLLSELARLQTRLLTQVDALARRYGWTEDQVLAVPAWRRQRYLTLHRQDDGWP